MKTHFMLQTMSDEIPKQLSNSGYWFVNFDVSSSFTNVPIVENNA